jgi:uncharacterized protein (TIGR00288 family)
MGSRVDVPSAWHAAVAPRRPGASLEPMAIDEERIGLFMDYENLAIGAREDLGGLQFDFKPIADALAERGRVVLRRAYADWNMFESDRRMLTQNHVELIEIPQRMGTVRKNAADIKMAVDAMELAFERDYVTTFVICTGDSDFTPLVHKLRELNKRVIGVGLMASTSALLPPACDEFLFYERLEGVDVPQRRPSKARRGGAARRDQKEEHETEEPAATARSGDLDDLAVLISQTLAGLQRSGGGQVRSSTLKRALLRKDPTFSEADYGFRAFGELLRHMESRNVVDLDDSGAKGDPEVEFPKEGRGEEAAFGLLVDVVREQDKRNGPAQLSGLKNTLRKRQADFSEKRYGFNGFLQFVKAAQARGLVELEWNDAADDYVLRIGPDAV